MTGYDSIPRFHEVYDQVPAQFRDQFIALLGMVPEGEREEVIGQAVNMALAVKAGDYNAFSVALTALGAGAYAPVLYTQFREVYLSDHHD